MRQKEIIGTFIKVPIDDEYHTYGRIMHKHVYAFYDFKTNSEDHELDEIEKGEVLFKLMIKQGAINKGGWKIIGKKELPEDLKKPVAFFIQSIGDHGDCWIDINEVRKKVHPDECKGLERFAIWEHHHVKQRLKDYYNDVPNSHAEALKVNRI